MPGDSLTAETCANTGVVDASDRDDAWYRFDIFMIHVDEVAASHGAAVLFGAGDGAQTTPETDGGNLVKKVKTYATARAGACP